MIHMYFAAEAVAETAEAAEASPLAALGVDAKSLIFQLITFFLVFLILKKFAFKPITKMLIERRKVIEDGVKMGQRMEKERAKLDADVVKVMRDARIEADKIIGNGQKEAREIIREAEKIGQRKVDTMIADAEARINEESKQATRRLEKEIVGLVSDATEAIVEEKVDLAKDAKLIEKALKSRIK
jgi:F-type H+-transporting ATPase subunit b